MYLMPAHPSICALRSAFRTGIAGTIASASAAGSSSTRAYSTEATVNLYLGVRITLGSLRYVSSSTAMSLHEDTGALQLPIEYPSSKQQDIPPAGDGER